DLACMVADEAGAEVQFLDNPRKEAAENELRMENEGLRSLGLDPVTLDQGLLEEVRDIAARFAHRCDMDKILARSQWTSGQAQSEDIPGAAEPARRIRAV
ncbi:MAG TPA: NAD-dependent dehydratase, partial [Gammaproteobacteria bacterium]|nr:NAD-dependent dehydratase [Gammaproteobacteria bacterium]